MNRRSLLRRLLGGLAALAVPFGLPSPRKDLSGQIVASKDIVPYHLMVPSPAPTMIVYSGTQRYRALRIGTRSSGTCWCRIIAPAD